MQTFLPYADFRETARVLDRQRLGKQRVESMQVMKALVTGEGSWTSHPAVKMWRGHEAALFMYQTAICQEWTGRGYKDTCLVKTFELVLKLRLERDADLDCELPAWLGDEAFHASHRSNLLRKSPDHYAQFGWAEHADLPYVWPTP